MMMLKQYRCWILVVLFLVYAADIHAQHTGIYLSPDVDTLYSHKEYKFKVENITRDSALIDISFDTGYFYSVSRQYNSTAYKPADIAVAYIRNGKDGNYDLGYEINAMVRAGKLKGTYGDSREGAYCNAYITVRKNKQVDTLAVKRYYVKFVLDTLRIKFLPYGYYPAQTGAANYPKLALAGTALDWYPENEAAAGWQKLKPACPPIKIDDLLQSLKKGKAFSFLQPAVGFRLEYLSFGGTETKTAADMDKVLNKLYMGISTQDRAYWLNNPLQLIIHLYNPGTGEYLVLPFNNIPLQ